MSLYTPDSIIRRLILEAEELTLNPSPDAKGIEDASSSTPDQVAADMQNLPAAGTASNPGMQGSALTLPQISQPAATTTKTIVNSEIILAQLAELKGLITTYEKKFDIKVQLTPEESNVNLSQLLSSLVFHANRLNEFMENSPMEAAPEASPIPEASPTEIPPQPESGLGEMPAVSEEPLVPPTPQAEPQV